MANQKISPQIFCAILIALVTQQVEATPTTITQCNEVDPCVSFTESGCTNGVKRICLVSTVGATGCVINVVAAPSVPAVAGEVTLLQGCSPGANPFIGFNTAGAEVCQETNTSPAMFGLFDTAPDAGPVTGDTFLENGITVSCSGKVSVCNQGSNSQLKLSYPFIPCPTTTTSTTTTTTTAATTKSTATTTKATVTAVVPPATPSPAACAICLKEVKPCTKSCGTGTRVLQCNIGGCPISSKIENCNTQACPAPVNGMPSWGQWSDCNRSCGPNRIQTRTRSSCTPAQNGGTPCSSFPTQQTRACANVACPVTGGNRGGGGGRGGGRRGGGRRGGGRRGGGGRGRGGRGGGGGRGGRVRGCRRRCKGKTNKNQKRCRKKCRNKGN